MPLISVVVPTHNRPEMLAEALASVRTQTFTDYDIIMVSNGESAEARGQSLAIATSYGARYFALSDGNVSAARNFGIEQATGEWIAFLDDDDIWLPNKLERHMLHTDIDMTISDCMSLYPDGTEKLHSMRPPAGSIHRLLCHGKWTALPTATVIRRAVLIELGSYDPAFRYGEDNELVRRIAWRHRIRHIPETLNRRRASGHDHLSDHLHANYGGEIRRYIKMRRDTPPELIGDVPSFCTFARRVVMRYATPHWLRHPRKFLAAFRS